MAEVTDPQAASPPQGCSRAKAEGAFIALAAGDALGWPQELPNKVLGGRVVHPVTTAFRSWVRRGGGRFYPFEEHIQAGEYSDDTQLALAVARCRMYGDKSWWQVLTRTELPLWTLYERGGGGATKWAAEMWIKETPPWKANDPRAVQRYFNAGGNGVTMRVLPHAIFYACQPDPASLVRDVVLDGVATHGHPRALVGATAYAFAAWWLLRSNHTIRFGELVQVLRDSVGVWGELPASNHTRNGWLDAADRNTTNGYKDLWSKVVDEMRGLLDRIQCGLDAGAIADDDEVLQDLGCFGEVKGAGTVSTAAAVYLCARYAAQPVQAVLRAGFARRADTDTLAAMSGGLAGCLAGKDWLPREWAELQDYKYLRRLADEVARGPSAAQDRPGNLRTIGRNELDGLRSALAEGHSGNLDLDGKRRAQVVDSVSPKTLSKTTLAQVWQLRTSDGQTIYITKLGRKQASDIPVARAQPLGSPSMLKTVRRAAPVATAKREARAAGGGGAAAGRPADRTVDPFPLGWRLRPAADADDGYERVPLTAADLLDPQEGDVVPEGNWHYRILDPVADLLRRVLEKRPAAGRYPLAVFRDVVMVRKGRPNLSPDVAVIAGLRRPTAPSRSVDLDQEDVRLLFAIEVISTSRKEIRDKDYVGNVRIYSEGGVPEYVAVETGDVDRGTPVKISAWRLDRERGRLQAVETDERGGFSSQTTGLWLGPDPAGPRLVVEDATTGERLRFSDEEEAARREAEHRVDELEREIARLRGRLGEST